MPRRDLPSLYTILDADALSARGWAPAEVCRVWLDSGIRLIQLRAKQLSSGAFLELADACTALCHDAGALFIVNDRADIAAMCGADGVHVGQEDLTVSDVRRVVGRSALVGLSTHTETQVIDALQQPISYVAIGPVFGTSSKDTGYEPLGLAAVRCAAAAAHAAQMPLVAIGGITRDNAAQVRAAGADSLAVIADLLGDGDWPDLEARARTWMRILGPEESKN